MNVLIIEPGKHPRVEDIAGTLESEQAIVGGMIETVYPWQDNAVLVCNDSGLIDHLPLNRQIDDWTIIAGTFFICSTKGASFASLSDEQLEKYSVMFHDPEVFFRAPGTELGVRGVTCSPEQYRVMMGTDEKPKKQKVMRKHDER